MWNQTSQYSRKRIILTPLIDVLFIILIFFMLVSSFNLDRGISIQSFSELGSSINSKTIAVIDIEKDKRSINGLEVKIDNLADELINLGTKKDIQIFLRPSEDLPVQDMIDVFDELSLENFQIIYILEP
jgi:biopolymer transport protein ExbD